MGLAPFVKAIKCGFLFTFLIHVVAGQRNLFLHGGPAGGEDFDDVMALFVEAAGGAGEARIGIITLATSAAIEMGEAYQDFFLSNGAAQATWIPITMENVAELAEDETIVEMILAQTGIFFEGGDQGRIITGLLRPDGSNTASLAAIREVFERGAVGGTSAGTACQGDDIAIAGGRSYEAWANPICSVDCGSSDDLSFYEKGIGFAYHFVTDSHFAARNREGRLIKLMFEAQDRTYYGIGVDESMALLIRNTGTADEELEVLGNAGGVTLIDVFNANYDENGPSATGVRLTYLSEGDKASLINGQIFIADWKTNLTGNEINLEAPESKDIFGESNGHPGAEFRYIATELFNARDTESTSHTKTMKPGFFVSTKKDELSSGWRGYSPTTGAWTTSYVNLIVDIIPAVN